MLTCRYTRTRLIAYINGELSLKARRRVAQHLYHCQRCSIEYRRELTVARSLQYSATVMGRAQRPQLQRMWAAIQEEMNPASQHNGGKHLSPARYGIVALVLVFALALPATLGNRNVPFSITQPVAPIAQVMVTDTPASVKNKSVATIALVSTDEESGEYPTAQYTSTEGEVISSTKLVGARGCF